jgi:hypothetical protein
VAANAIAACSARSNTPQSPNPGLTQKKCAAKRSKCTGEGWTCAGLLAISACIIARSPCGFRLKPHNCPILQYLPRSRKQRWTSCSPSSGTKNQFFVITIVDRLTRCYLGFRVAWKRMQAATQEMVNKAPKARRYYSYAFDVYDRLWYH